MQSRRRVVVAVVIVTIQVVSLAAATDILGADVSTYAKPSETIEAVGTEPEFDAGVPEDSAHAGGDDGWVALDESEITPDETVAGFEQAPEQLALVDDQASSDDGEPEVAADPIIDRPTDRAATATTSTTGPGDTAGAAGADADAGTAAADTAAGDTTAGDSLSTDTTAGEITASTGTIEQSIPDASAALAGDATALAGTTTIPAAGSTAPGAAESSTTVALTEAVGGDRRPVAAIETQTTSAPPATSSTTAATTVVATSTSTSTATPVSRSVTTATAPPTTWLPVTTNTPITTWLTTTAPTTTVATAPIIPTTSAAATTSPPTTVPSTTRPSTTLPSTTTAAPPTTSPPSNGGANAGLSAISNTDPRFSQYASLPSAALSLAALTEPALVRDNGSVGDGQFRAACQYSHFAYDDPIVYPGQIGRSHLHMFFGNTLTNANSTTNSIVNSGGGSCNGFELNRSAYWTPALLDGKGNAVVPDMIILYYKSKEPNNVQRMPQGLKMVSGNTSAESFAVSDFLYWSCGDSGFTYNRTNRIPDCGGATINATIAFPQCWDGVNLDSANHRSHMALVSPHKPCPASHPVRLPQISILFYFPGQSSVNGWHLASDRTGFSTGPGSSLHADWWGGWNDEAMDLWTNGCMKAARNCSFGQTGTDRQLAKLNNFQKYQGPNFLPLP